jgi:DNA-binding Lrp family transcriptional regulator
MTQTSLDKLDLRILSALEARGRMTNRDLADLIGLSQSACLERVKRLDKTGVVTGYRAQINPNCLGDWIGVTALITLDHQGKAHADAFEARMSSLAQVVSCAEVSGACDYIASFVCTGIAQYQGLTADLLDDEALGVREIKSYVTLRTVKGDLSLGAAALLAGMDP